MAALDDPRNECEARAAAAAQEAWGQVVDFEASHMLALGVRPPWGAPSGPAVSGWSVGLCQAQTLAWRNV